MIGGAIYSGLPLICHDAWAVPKNPLVGPHVGRALLKVVVICEGRLNLMHVQRPV